jgi:hypothetical protein
VVFSAEANARHGNPNIPAMCRNQQNQIIEKRLHMSHFTPRKLAGAISALLVSTTAAHAQFDTPTPPSTARERAQIARSQLTALETLGLPWNRPWFRDYADVENDVRDPIDFETWRLLVEEVHRDRDVNALTNEMLNKLGVTEVATIEAAGKTGLTEEQVRQAVTDFIAVHENARVTMPDGDVTEEEAKAWLQETRLPIEVAYVALNIRDVVDKKLTFPEGVIQAQFNQYRHENPESPQNQYGFAYALPKRVRAQFIAFDRDDLIKNTEVTELQAREWFETHRASFPEVARYEDAADEITRSAKIAHAAERGDRIAQMLHDKMTIPWRRADLGHDRYKIAPEPIKPIDYLESLAKSLREVEKVDARVVDSGLIPINEAGKLPDIGDAKWKRDRSDYIAFKHLIKRVQGFEINLGLKNHLAYALYEPMPVFANRDQGHPSQWFIARVIETRDSGSDANLADVRDKVIHDLQYTEAFRTVGHSLKAFADSAVDSGLANAWPASDIAKMFPNTKVQQPEPFARRKRVNVQVRRLAGQSSLSPELPDIGASEKFLDELFGFAAHIRDREDVNSDIHWLHLFERFSEGQWILAEILDPGVVRTVNPDEFADAAAEILQARYHAHAANWFNPKNVRDRAAANKENP